MNRIKKYLKRLVISWVVEDYQANGRTRQAFKGDEVSIDVFIEREARTTPEFVSRAEFDQYHPASKVGRPSEIGQSTIEYALLLALLAVAALIFLFPTARQITSGMLHAQAVTVSVAEDGKKPEEIK